MRKWLIALSAVVTALTIAVVVLVVVVVNQGRDVAHDELLEKCSGYTDVYERSLCMEQNS